MDDIKKLIQAVRKQAAALPNVEEGLACAGTKVESTTFGIGKKVFLFVQMRDTGAVVRLKLKESVTEAQGLAREQPSVYSIGGQGWAKVAPGDGHDLPAGLLTRWVTESYQLVTGPGAAAKGKATAKRRQR